MTITMPKAFLFGIKIENKSWKTGKKYSNSKISQQNIKDRRYELGNIADGEFLRYDNNSQ